MNKHIQVMYELYAVVIDNFKVIDISNVPKGIILPRDKLVFLDQLLSYFVFVLDFSLGHGSCEDGVSRDSICGHVVEDGQRIWSGALVGGGGLVGRGIAAQCLLDIVSEVSVIGMAS